MFHVLVSWHEIDNCGRGDTEGMEFWEFRMQSEDVYTLRMVLATWFKGEETSIAVQKILKTLSDEASET